jgi:FAD/FMN-containing dehydrogenase
MKLVFCFILYLISCFSIIYCQEDSVILSDRAANVFIPVAQIYTPTDIPELCQVIEKHTGTISIGGAKNSMGGQIGHKNSLHINMNQLNQIVSFDRINKEISVQAGITWYEIQQYIDSFDLSVQVMQTYANFSVGGSVSTNVHGRYLGHGPLVESILSLKIILGDGRLIQASPNLNSDLFYAAIGGYGLLGVIVEVKLKLVDNSKIERTTSTMKMTEYLNYFELELQGNSSVIFHNADIYPKKYKRIRNVNYSLTSLEITDSLRLKVQKENYPFNQKALSFISNNLIGKWCRQHVFDPFIYRKETVSYRNHEASYDIMELEPKSREKSTYLLQEYFVSKENFKSFSEAMISILKENKVNVINISIRNTKPDTLTYLSWAETEVFSFVIYYNQELKINAIKKEMIWSSALIDEVIKAKGTYYLPYKVLATKDQFKLAYPKWEAFKSIKLKYDPDLKFQNVIWDNYFSS